MSVEPRAQSPAVFGGHNDPFDIRSYRCVWFFRLEPVGTVGYYSSVLFHSTVFVLVLYLTGLVISGYYNFPDLY